MYNMGEGLLILDNIVYCVLSWSMLVLRGISYVAMSGKKLVLYVDQMMDAS